MCGYIVIQDNILSTDFQKQIHLECILRHFMRYYNIKTGNVLL